MVTCLFKAPQHRRDDDSDENKAEAMSGWKRTLFCRGRSLGSI